MIEGGEPCPKCALPMQRCTHGEQWRPKVGQPYYFRFWDRCLKCKHLQHYESAKTWIDRTESERANQEPFDMDRWERI